MALLTLGLLHLAPAPPRSLISGSHPMHAARAAVSAVRQRSCHCCASATRSARAIDLAERHCSPEPARFAALRDETAQRWPGGAHMVSGAQQGRLLHMLVRLSRASRVLEVGCFSGYAAMWMGLALPAGGKLLSLERDERAAAVARAHLASAGLSDRVEVRLGDAMDALEALPGPRCGEAPFELIFLDADKKRSWEYLELIVSRQLLAPHGLLLIDNVLWKGEVLARLDPAAVCATSAAASSLTPSARRSMELRDALHAFSTRLAADERMDQLLLPLRDGLTWAQHAPASGASEAASGGDPRAWDGTHEDKMAAYLRFVGSPEPSKLAALRQALAAEAASAAEETGYDSAAAAQAAATTRISRGSPEDLARISRGSPEDLARISREWCGVQQGRLLHMLVRLSRASRVLEVGCFSGYAAMWMGLALPAGGKLLSLERDERAAAVARAHLASAGLSDRVEVRLGDAMDALGALPGPFELIVISAEALQVVPSAEAAMRCALANLASHGLVIVVAQPATVSEDPTIHEHARQEDARQEDAPRGALVPMLLSLARQVEPAAHAVTLPSPDGDGGVLTLIGRTLEM